MNTWKNILMFPSLLQVRMSSEKCSTIHDIVLHTALRWLMEEGKGVVKWGKRRACDEGDRSTCTHSIHKPPSPSLPHTHVLWFPQREKKLLEGWQDNQAHKEARRGRKVMSTSSLLSSPT